MEKELNRLVKIKSPEEGQEAYGYKFNKGRWSKIKVKKDFVSEKQNTKLHVRTKRLIVLLSIVEILEIIGLVLLLFK